MNLTLVHIVVVLQLTGGSLFAGQASQGAQSPELTEHIKAIEGCLQAPVAVKNVPKDCHSISQRMAELQVPALSVAVIHNGQIEWAKGYGVKQLQGEAVTAETLFQAGSISKPLAALGALRLVQEGKLSLDGDINRSLRSWKIPASPAAPGAVVTLRELLTHTAGLTVHGFPGYEAGTPVPTLTQVLDGKPPANTEAIRLDSMPGKAWRYSGGGFTVMQQAVIDVAAMPFPEFLHQKVLMPIGMGHSSYAQPLPTDDLKKAAMPFADGKPVKGGPHTYPEMAAAGLWTTPSDLCHYIFEVQQSLQGKANHVLSQTMTEQMLTKGKGSWGLGVQVGGSSDKPWFSHGGVNAGYESLFVGYEHSGEGAAVMTNAEGGTQLAGEVMRAIAVAYQWPDWKPIERTQVIVHPETLAKYVGVYQLAPGFDVAFTLEGKQLMTQATGQDKIPAYPESQKRFFLKQVDAEMEFYNNEQGQVSYVVITQGAQDHKGMRK